MHIGVLYLWSIRKKKKSLYHISTLMHLGLYAFKCVLRKVILRPCYCHLHNVDIYLYIPPELFIGTGRPHPSEWLRVEIILHLWRCLHAVYVCTLALNSLSSNGGTYDPFTLYARKLLHKCLNAYSVNIVKN